MLFVLKDILHVASVAIISLPKKKLVSFEKFKGSINTQMYVQYFTRIWILFWCQQDPDPFSYDNRIQIWIWIRWISTLIRNTDLNIKYIYLSFWCNRSWKKNLMRISFTLWKKVVIFRGGSAKAKFVPAPIPLDHLLLTIYILNMIGCLWLPAQYCLSIPM